ncbi:hypothetical protein CTI14_42725 [Methylobacterium radiotolerans]|nr:hypothetical protein CTI14_42725 [Methylobacterium radiotolerans]
MLRRGEHRRRGPLLHDPAVLHDQESSATAATRSDEATPEACAAKDVDLRGLDALSYLRRPRASAGATLSSVQVQQLAPVMAAGLGIIVTD